MFATSKSKSLVFTVTPPYTPSVSGRVKYGKAGVSGSRKVTIDVTVTGVKGNGNGAPTGTVSANDGFTCSALTPVAGKLISKATCTNVVPSGTSEEVQVGYGGDSIYDSGSTLVYVSVGGGA